MAFIECDGKHFALVDGSLKQSYVPLQSSPFRVTGVTLRENDPSIGHYIYDGFPDGIGWAQMNRRTGRGGRGLVDATADTRFNPITPGRLHEADTGQSSADHIRAYLNYQGNAYGFFEEDYVSGGLQDIVARQYDASLDQWDATGGGNIATPSNNAVGARIFHGEIHKGTMALLTNNCDATNTTELQYAVFSSTDGGTWTVYANLPGGANNLLTTTVTRRNNFEDTDHGKLLDYGTFLIGAVIDLATDNRIEIYSTADVGGTAWDVGGTIQDAHIQALLKWRDPFDLSVIVPIIVTERNVYKIGTDADSVTTSITALLPTGILQGDADDGRGATVGQDGNLYLPLASGEILKVQLLSENNFRFVPINPPDGFVAARQGHVNYILAPPVPWMVVAYGGHVSGDQANIWYVDYKPRIDPESGKEYHPFHSGYLEATANQDLYLIGYSSASDDVPKLHFALEGNAASELFHIDNPFAHPESGVTIKYQTDSELRLPTDDQGDPHTTKTYYTARVNADDLTAGSAGAGGATDEFIMVEYGLDGAADDTTELGDFLSGQLSLNFGTGGVGVSGSKIAVRLTLDRGSTNTNCPKLFEFELIAEARLVFKRAWEFTADIEATAQEYAGDFTLAENQQAQEAIIAALETIAESSTLVAFIAGQQSSTLVRCPNDAPPVFSLQVVGSGGEQAGFRTGRCQMRLEEVR